jgi:hypothetical protein
MENTVKWKGYVLVTETYYKAFLGLMGFKKDVYASVCHYLIGKGFGEGLRCGKLPITVNNLLQPGVRQPLLVVYMLRRLFNGRLNRGIPFPDVS